MKQLLNQYKIKYRFVIINDLADVSTIVKDNLQPTDKGIVIVGGNATVNAVINATVTENLPLGIVPMSKTNYLAKSIGIKRWEQAIKMLTEPELKAERLGKIGKHYFVRRVAITSRQNLLTKYLTKTSPVLKFLGLTKSSSTENSQILTKILLDDELSASGQTQKLEISLSPSQEVLSLNQLSTRRHQPGGGTLRVGNRAGDNSNKGEKKLHIRLFVPTKDGLNTSLLHGDFLTVDSDKKMPVTMGNETIAFTPVGIKGLSKHIQLIVPKGINGKLTESISS